MDILHISSIREFLQWEAILSIGKPHAEEDKAKPGSLTGKHLFPGVSEGAVHVSEPIFLVAVPVLLEC